MVPEQALLLEAELREHGDGRLLLGDDLDHELHHAELEGLDDGPLGEQPAEAAPAVLGVDDEAQLADVAAPADAVEDGHVADDLVVDERDEAVLVGVGEPAVDTPGSSTSSRKNVRSPSGTRAKKRRSASTSSR